MNTSSQLERLWKRASACRNGAQVLLKSGVLDRDPTRAAGPCIRALSAVAWAVCESHPTISDECGEPSKSNFPRILDEYFRFKLSAPHQETSLRSALKLLDEASVCLNGKALSREEAIACVKLTAGLMNAVAEFLDIDATQYDSAS